MRASYTAIALVTTGALILGAARADDPLTDAYTYSSTADFTEAFAINTNTNGGDQLQVNRYPVPLPYIWIALAHHNTIVRIRTDTDTADGAILGEYWSMPQGLGRDGDPSRTTVDLFGDVWAGNRAENGADPGWKGSVVKIGLVIGGTRVNADGSPCADGNCEYLKPPFDYCTCVDSNDDRLIHTSYGRHTGGWANVLPWDDVTDGEGGGGGGGGAYFGDGRVEDADDECILIFQRVNGSNVRHVSVDDDNNVWVGGHAEEYFDLLDCDTGGWLDGWAPEDVGGNRDTGYGGFVDGNGVLWSSTKGGTNDILRYDTATGDHDWIMSRDCYGLGLDSAGNIWSTKLLAQGNGHVAKFDPNGDPLCEPYPAWGCPYVGNDWDRGVTVTPADNDVWIANSGYWKFPDDGTTIARLDNDASVEAIIDLNSNGDGEGPSGVSVDSTGKVWVSCYTSDTAKRIDPDTNEVDFTVPLGDGADPYNYSDMTGLVGMLALKNGMWTVIHDSGVDNTTWHTVSWNDVNCTYPDTPVPAGTALIVEVRAANSETGLTRQDFDQTTSGETLDATTNGRYLQVRVVLNGTGYDDDFVTPVLCDLTVEWEACPCIYDLDESCFVDSADLGLFAPCWLLSEGNNGWDQNDCADKDFDCTGTVDATDLGLFAGAWLKNCHEIDASLYPSCRACTGPVYCETPAIWTGDCNSNGTDDDDDIAGGTSADCNGNGTPDECDIDAGTSADANSNGVPDECQLNCGTNGTLHCLMITFGVTPDCNTNAIPDECDIRGGTSADINSNGVPDECEDCNTNGTPDDMDISGGTSADCDSNGLPDECSGDCNTNAVWDDCDIHAGTSADCNDNQVPDECDIAEATSADCNSDGTPDECQTDCNANGVPDDCDIDSATSQDCNTNGTPDECETDCNDNGVPDDCDIDGATSADCNANATPDECETDCNTNGVPDDCDIGGATSADCNSNGRPDECDIDGGFRQDCNTNGVPDECDTNFGTSEDCNYNGVPDECESQADCQSNGIKDICDLALGTSTDWNYNKVPDECDIASGTSQDCNSNGTPDESEWDCNTNGIPDDCDVDGSTSQDCNTNDVPDECDIAGSTSEDENTNGIPDECLCADTDVNCDGYTDTLDVGVVKNPANWLKSVSQAANERADVNCSDWVDAVDLGVIKNPANWLTATGPCECEPHCGRDGGGGGPYDPWSTKTSSAVLELRPVGGGEPLNTLRPHTTYELHYAEAAEPVEWYTLFAMATSDDQGIGVAKPAEDGPWADTGVFAYSELVEDGGDGDSGAYVAYDGVFDDTSGSVPLGGTTGHLCTITTECVGELSLHLSLARMDLETFVHYDMVATHTWKVTDTDDGGTGDE